MQLALNKYLKTLREKARQFEELDINGTPYDSNSRFIILKLIFITISVFSIIIIKKGLPNAFVSYFSTILSIFVGLFITALIFSFDKFYDPIKKNEEEDSKKEKAVVTVADKLFEKQSLNFIRQFAYITGYTIVLSIFSIFILMLSTLFEDYFMLDITELTLVVHEISVNSVSLFIRAVLCFGQRFLIFYWILRILYNTLFVVSGLVIHMIAKINRSDTNR